MSPTAHKSTGSPEAAPDDASIPVLTERLTLPPLEFDTSLPMELSLDTSVAREATAPAQPPPQPPARPPAVAPALELSLDTTLPRQTAAPARTPAAAPSPIAAVTAAPPASAAPAPSAAASVDAAGSHWTRIELELRSSILQSIADSLPQQVDAIVRGRMNDAIEQMVAQLAAETRLALAASLREIVDQAVRTELARLRGKKR